MLELLDQKVCFVGSCRGKRIDLPPRRQPALPNEPIHNWNRTTIVLIAEVATYQLADDVAADTRIDPVRPTQRTALGILDVAALFRYCQSLGLISGMQVFGPTRRCFFLRRPFLRGRPE
jgi:hypothetical protein